MTQSSKNSEGVITLCYPLMGELHVKEGQATGAVVVAVVTKDGEIVCGSCSSEGKKSLIFELNRAVAEVGGLNGS